MGVIRLEDGEDLGQWLDEMDSGKHMERQCSRCWIAYRTGIQAPEQAPDEVLTPWEKLLAKLAAELAAKPTSVYQTPSYNAAHKRVRKQRGPAAEHSCMLSGLPGIKCNGRMNWANLTGNYNGKLSFPAGTLKIESSCDGTRLVGLG